MLNSHHEIDTDLVNIEEEELAINIILLQSAFLAVCVFQEERGIDVTPFPSSLVLVALHETPNLPMAFTWWGDQN